MIQAIEYWHRFLTAIQDKKALADLTVVQGGKWIGEWSNKELRDIFELRETES
jgi:hypothetical protein